jgi:hypothetical protein
MLTEFGLVGTSVRNNRTESEEKVILYNLSIDLGAMVVEGSAGGILAGEHT